MSKYKRIKNICCHFTRNLAYHQAGIRKSNNALERDFWRIANGNFAEIAILEFCKLFGGRNEKHRWVDIVDDEENFKKQIEIKTALSFNEFEKYVEDVKKYRDKYLSHLDDAMDLELPHLQVATKAVFTYYEYVVSKDGVGAFPEDLQNFYMTSFAEAEGEYPLKS